MVILQFQISDDIFWGFRFSIESQDLLTKNEPITYIINKIKMNLMDKLKELNLLELVEKLKKKNFHIHDFKLEDLSKEDRDIYYICCHC